MQKLITLPASVTLATLSDFSPLVPIFIGIFHICRDSARHLSRSNYIVMRSIAYDVKKPKMWCSLGAGLALRALMRVMLWAEAMSCPSPPRSSNILRLLASYIHMSPG